jgi:hypothetical protein
LPDQEHKPRSDGGRGSFAEPFDHGFYEPAAMGAADLKSQALEEDGEEVPEYTLRSAFEVHLLQLDEVATGVVEDRELAPRHVAEFLRERHSELGETLVIGVEVIRKERRDGNTLLAQRFLIAL